jgi:hypothetical protein
VIIDPFGSKQSDRSLRINPSGTNVASSTSASTAHDRWVHANLPSANRCWKKHKPTDTTCDKAHREALILFHNENTHRYGKEAPPGEAKKKGKKGRK